MLPLVEELLFAVLLRFPEVVPHLKPDAVGVELAPE
jgi:hypothetical protein